MERSEVDFSVYWHMEGVDGEGRGVQVSFWEERGDL